MYARPSNHLKPHVRNNNNNKKSSLRTVKQAHIFTRVHVDCRAPQLRVKLTVKRSSRLLIAVVLTGLHVNIDKSKCFHDTEVSSENRMNNVVQNVRWIWRVSDENQMWQSIGDVRRSIRADERVKQ